MQRKFHDIPQNNDDWLNMRMGRFTASAFKELFGTKTNVGYKKAIYRLAYERLTGESPEEMFQSEYMKRGHELEPFAVESYEERNMVETSPGGFWTLGDRIGASPDRHVGDDGMLEIKCPAYNTQIDYLLSGKLPSVYKWQVVGQMYVADRDWVDFFSYHPKLAPLQVRVNRDEKLESELVKTLEASIEAAEKVFNKLKGKE